MKWWVNKRRGRVQGGGGRRRRRKEVRYRWQHVDLQ
jgi:hypothetical protein